MDFVLKKDIKSFLKVIVFGICMGSLCATLDLIPNNNIWTFSSFSGSLGFWAITGMIVLMQSNNWKLACINIFLYFGFMNTAFFFVHLLLPLEFPRFTGVDNAAIQSLVWLIPSFICGICAIVAYQAKKNNKWGIIVLSLPLGLLIYESVATFSSVIINHKFLFQTIVDISGFILLFLLYKDKKKNIYVLLTSLLFGTILLLIQYLLYGGILYY
jgi:hypothetical protein